MISRLDRKQERLLLRACTMSEIFPLLHGPLCHIQQEYDELSPVEVWVAAVDFSAQLLSMNEPELEVKYLVDELREECDTENGAFLVMLASAYRLAPLRKKDSRVVPAIKALLPYYCEHPLYRDLILAIGDVEDERIKKKGCINLLEYQLVSLPSLSGTDGFDGQYRIMNEFAEVAMLCNCKVLGNVINVFSEFNDNHKGQFSDILERMRKKQHELDQPNPITYIQNQHVGEQNILQDNAQLLNLGLQGIDEQTRLLLAKLLIENNQNQLTDGK